MRVLLTGASRGIGAAIAERLAAQGADLVLIARDPTRLGAVAERARALGARVEASTGDVTDAAAMAETLARCDAAAPIDLVIANAGQSTGAGPGGRLETAADARRMISVNLVGAINTVAPLLLPMQARGRGRIVLISSLAAIRPLPSMPAYGASKAGLRAYGIALRGALRDSGVGVTVVCPGFVATPMSARHKGRRPFEVPVDDAAERIIRGVGNGRAFVTFPWPLAVMSWVDARLPAWLSDRLARGFAAEIRPED
ncbi:MAG: SDR family NAD(P)-dependent oxidoreductase [Pseudomonadota bacterium]